MQKTRGLWSELFGIDLRSLAVFRIALGSLLLWDLADRSRDFLAHYTDSGVLPGSMVSLFAGRGSWLSLHVWASGSVWAEGFLFVLAAVAALALILGFQTRLATLVSWYLLISLQVRHPWIAGMGGDKLVRLQLFWSFFLPLGARFSLDARGNPALRHCADRITSPATAALLLQLAFMYWITAFRKDGAAWMSGEAVHLALNLDFWVTSFGVWLRQFGAMLKIASFATLAFEFLGPLLAFSPVKNGSFRLATIAMFVVFHLSIAAALSIGYFPAVSLVGWCAFLPREFWERVAARFGGLTLRAQKEQAPPLAKARWEQGFAALCLVYVMLFLLPQIPGLGFPRLPERARLFGRALHINQYWSMFSPEPPAVDAWPEVWGVLPDGRQIDVLRGGPLSLEKPESFVSTWSGVRWRLYYSKLLSSERTSSLFEPSVRSLARYYCRSPLIGRPDDERLVHVKLIRVAEPTAPPSRLERDLLLDWTCEDIPGPEPP